MGATSIEWTDVTWNPVRGCTKVSPGCKHCYAETFSERWRGVKGHAFEQGFELRLVPEKLGEPLTWKKSRRVFVNSMSDLFHEDVPDEYIAAVFGVMASSPTHTFQVLTKRAERMVRWFAWLDAQVAERDAHRGRSSWAHANVCQDAALARGIDGVLHPIKGTLRAWPWPLQNVWLGVSAEDQPRANERIPLLFRVPARVRFLSCEPLLESVKLRGWLGGRNMDRPPAEGGQWVPGIQWVIVGGESGPGARPYEVEWARSIIGQCRAANVAVFHKQLGARPVGPSINYPGSGLGAARRLGMLDRKGGDPSEWPEDLRVREFPEVR